MGDIPMVAELLSTAVVGQEIEAFKNFVDRVGGIWNALQ
jgi:hypothetical protein